jgi:cold shock CspA family protein
METSPRIEFIDIEPDADIRAEIGRQLAALETRFGRITACRVAVRSPGRHHQDGGPYEIEISLALPGRREVNVGRTRHNDERLADIHFALNHAFKRARRQLQDNVRRLQGSVKRHDGPPSGTIARLVPEGDYGFIAAPDGGEIYFHRNSLLNADFDSLLPGTRVTYAEEAGEKGTQASTVRVIGRLRRRA